MTKYEKIDKLLNNFPKESLKICPSSSGCVTKHGISKADLERYLKRSKK